MLIIGGGGREHTLVWKIRQHPEVKQIYCIPGNGGIAALAECPALDAGDFPTLASFVREREIGFTVVGPEQPLVDGIVDYFEAEKLPIFGPNRSAARLEGSKIFSKQLMAKYDIPTAGFAEFDRVEAALKYLSHLPEQPIVVKADGLAAGKGSIVCPNLNSAREAVDALMRQKIFAAAGSKVVIEEFMTGEEVSIFAITDGRDYLTLTPAQDFKRALDGDRGKNTGGMGSYAPTPFLTPQLREAALRTIVEPTFAALQSEGIDYRGVLYFGLMLTSGGPKVIEFNCRFGDPETQVVLPLLDSDLLEILQAVHRRTLGKLRLELKPAHAAAVVLAAGGYPDAYEKGREIRGIPENRDDLMVFHAGTRREGGLLLTNGGRVMAVTALSEASLQAATEKAYQAVAQIHFDGMHFRRDIARRAWKV
ncbi:MAG: phosphoribosylamine--glycine ligase [Calditrichaeota bacterium]|nr:phosphoribosylamine--glycine ligase [Calditrichota bacterium]